MANNDIHVKIDHNNLIYVDPNSVVSNNTIIPRTIEQENLVMYVNLEADMVARSFLYANTTNSNDKSKTTHIAGGTLNFLRKQSGQDFGTEWTEVFTPSTESKSSMDIDITGQSFGIQNINIVVKGANFIPQVVINFVDVRGKVLFDSPKNSPYAAFFNLPWPIFYLTIKGYFGKAIKYRLHMVKFTNKFNGSTGNFETTATFVGSTYAYMSDIPLSAVLNSPYMFLREKEVITKTNGKDNTVTTVISKDTKGYQMLKSVYDEMKAKKLIPQDFPVITLRELQIIAETLDKRLSETIFKRIISPELIASIKNYGDQLSKLSLAINGWIDLNVSKSKEIIQNEDYYYLLNPNNLSKNILDKNVSGSLENLLVSNNELLIKFSDFKKIAQTDKKLQLDTKMFTKKMGQVENYYKKQYGNYLINKDLLLSDVNELKKTFNEQSEKIYSKIEEEMNTILKSKDSGIGFEPTLRNVLAIILSNADVYIRLMKETHIKSYNASNERKDIVKSFDGETQNSESVFPWPQIKKKNKLNGSIEIAYPGDPELRDVLGATDGRIWPEVELIEEFVKASTFKNDPSEKEGGKGLVNFVFESDEESSYINEISSLFINEYPYSDKTISSFIYEIAERAKYITYIDSYDSDILKKLAKLESSTINKFVKNESDISAVFFNEIKTVGDLKSSLEKYSENKRYPYFLDSVPTIEYIDKCLTTPFSIEENTHITSNPASNNDEYREINDLIQKSAYTPEVYRSYVYPFSSDEYLKYVQETPTTNKFKIKGVMKINSSNEFMSVDANPKMWVKQEHITGDTINMFSQRLNIGDNYTNILNTPYFHIQLHEDFHNQLDYGKYAGSAYLLLNSLPFYDLEDIINIGTDLKNPDAQVRMSSLFREVGATHYIPYHLLIKWGSIYHRYKTKINSDVDIISNDTINSIDFHKFFNNGTSETYTIGTETISYSGDTHIGFHPYHDAVFCQIVNGYNHFDVTPGSGNTLNQNINSGAVIPKTEKTTRHKYWSMVVDNSKFNNNDLRYTLLPTNGGNRYYGDNIELQDANFRPIWEDEFITTEYSGVTLPSYKEYFRSFNENDRINDNLYSISENYRKCIDLIGTFSPQILDVMESMFLDFATEILNVEKQYEAFEGISYNKFQTLLKSLSTIQKLSGDTNNMSFLKNIKSRQTQEILNVSQNLCSYQNLLKVTIGNPKEIDPYVLEGFALGTTTFKYNQYNPSQLSGNTKYIELYVGEDIDSNYSKFFIDNNVELNEENVLRFRPIIMIYAGYLKNNGDPSKVEFSNYLRDNIINTANRRYDLFLTDVMSGISGTQKQNLPSPIRYNDGYELNKIKTELYSSFKSFNDKWASGNSIGENLLLEDFLFLDKANRDIGQRAYINIDRLKSLLTKENITKDLYSAISILLQGTGFDMRALPAYVNFYGKSNPSSKTSAASKTANDLFGVFTDVDYNESSPKIVIQYVDLPSSHLEMENQGSLYKSDTYHIGEINNNSTLLTMPTLFSKEEMERSNKVVAFEVNFGDSEQNIFKEISLDQETIRNTSESFVVLEMLGSNESGAGAQSVDTQLFEYYRQAAYSCEVTCMGNVMIQPTMYFYLNNVPMFRGTYWITEVSHSLGEGSFKTTFKGSRMPAPSFPTLEDSFMATYRSLLERIQQQAIAVVKQKETETDETNKKSAETKKLNTNNTSVNEISVVTSSDKPNDTSISRVMINGEEYYEARVVEMGSSEYTIPENQIMSVISNSYLRHTWDLVKITRGINLFYSTQVFDSVNGKETKYNDIINGVTRFYNPKTKKWFNLNHNYDFSNGIIANGLINNGPWRSITKTYGIGMSIALMKTLKVKNGDTIYFKILKNNN